MRVATTTVIKASPEHVWEFITVVENGPRWQEGAVWTRVSTPGPMRLGSAAEHEGKWLGMRIRTTGEVTVFEPPFRFGYTIRSRLTPKPSVMRYEIEPIAGGSKLTLSNEADLGAWLRPLAPLLQRNVQGMFERDISRLKAVIEAEAVADAHSPSSAPSGDGES